MFLVAASLAALTSLAQAADLPYTKAPPAPVAPSNWTAFYIGGFVGGTWGTGNFCGFGGATLGERCSDFKVNGVVGGGYVGFDYELPNRVVIGARLSAPFGSISKTDTAPLGFGPAGTTITAKFNWAALANGTVGYDFGQWMPYVGAGVAVASVDATINPSALFTPSSATGQEQLGVNFLAGAKYAFTRNWALGVQYNHIEFERVVYTFVGPVGAVALGPQPVQIRQDSLVGTVDYRF
jgi:opacity protein-like surface antigen